MTTEAALAERAKPAQAVGATGFRFWTVLVEGEDALEPLPSPLETLLVFVTKADQEAEDEGEQVWNVELWGKVAAETMRMWGRPNMVKSMTALAVDVDEEEEGGEGITKGEESGLEH